MGYVTVAEVRAEGVPGDATHEVTDARVQAAINLWSQVVERLCRQWFESRALTVLMDGNGADTLWLPVPVISLSALYVNGDFTTVLDPLYYEVFNSRTVPDDRKNPKVQLKHEKRDLFEKVLWDEYPIFTKGQRNQKLVGNFGFTEPDGTTPLLIKRAVLKLISKSLSAMYAGWPALPPSGGPVSKETTDGHSIEYAISTTASSGLMGLTGDPEIVQIIRMYSAPTTVAVPESYDLV